MGNLNKNKQIQSQQGNDYLWNLEFDRILQLLNLN